MSEYLNLMLNFFSVIIGDTVAHWYGDVVARDPGLNPLPRVVIVQCVYTVRTRVYCKISGYR